MTEPKKMNKKEIMMINSDMIFLLRSAESARKQNIRKRTAERILSVRNVRRKNTQQIAATITLIDQRTGEVRLLR